MTVQRVQDVTLAEIPDLERRILARGKQVATIGMELDTVDI